MQVLWGTMRWATKGWRRYIITAGISLTLVAGLRGGANLLEDRMPDVVAREIERSPAFRKIEPPPVNVTANGPALSADTEFAPQNDSQGADKLQLFHSEKISADEKTQILSSLKSADPLTKASAVILVGQHQIHEIASQIVEYSQSASENIIVKRAAISALGSLNHPQSESVANQCMHDNDETIRIAAYLSLSKRGTVTAVASLIEQWKSQGPILNADELSVLKGSVNLAIYGN